MGITLLFPSYSPYADSFFFFSLSIFTLLWFDSAMELALSLEKLVNEKLLNLHSVMPLCLSSFGLNCFLMKLLIVFNLH